MLYSYSYALMPGSYKQRFVIVQKEPFVFELRITEGLWRSYIFLRQLPAPNGCWLPTYQSPPSTRVRHPMFRYYNRVDDKKIQKQKTRVQFFSII